VRRRGDRGEVALEDFDAEVRRQLKDEADGSLFDDVLFSQVMAAAVRSRLVAPDRHLERLGRGRPRSPAGPLRRCLVVAVVGAILATGSAVAWPRVAGEVGLGDYPPGVTLVAEGKEPQPGEPRPGRPAPMPFPHDLRIAADPYPVATGQALTIESDAGWPGQRVWVYAAPGRDQGVLFYQKQLPRDVILLGRAGIDADGRWSLDWVVPDRLERGEESLLIGGAESLVYVVGVTDSGYLAATGLPVGPARTLSVSPDPVAVGREMVLEGAGYPAGLKLRIDLLHDRPEGGTDLQVIIGWVVTDQDGRFTFRYTLPDRLNWPYADNKGTMADHWLDVGQGGRYYLQVLENHPGLGPGPHLFKRVNVTVGS
jgi:hypothetical protein